MKIKFVATVRKGKIKIPSHFELKDGEVVEVEIKSKEEMGVSETEEGE